MRYRVKGYEVSVATDYVLISFMPPTAVFDSLTTQSGSTSLNAASKKRVLESIRLIVDETRKGYILCATGQKVQGTNNYDIISDITKTQALGVISIEFYKTDLRTAAGDDQDDLAAIDAMTSSDRFTIEMDWGEDVDGAIGDVAAALEYMEQGGMPEISAIAKQGSNSNANISEIQSKIGTPASGQPSDLFAAIAAGGGGGGGEVITYPTVQMTAASAAIDPNKVYIWGEMSAITITALNAGEQGVANVYFLEFYSGATATTLTLPASVTDVRGMMQSNKIINVAILNGIAYIA